MSQARLFDGAGPAAPDADVVSPRTGRRLSTRTLAQRRQEAHRIALMHRRHGHGPEGQPCRGCVHLMRKPGGYAKSFLKCALYNREGYEGTDWRAKWPACGRWKEEPRATT